MMGREHGGHTFNYDVRGDRRREGQIVANRCVG